MFRFNPHPQGAHYLSSNNSLPDNGDETETCRSCFNVNFNIILKQEFVS
jgi:hypothetical protein